MWTLGWLVSWDPITKGRNVIPQKNGILSYNVIRILKLAQNNSLWIKPTDALNSNFIGITTLHVSGSLSAHHQEFLAVHRLWYILCSCDEPFANRSRMESSSILLLVANGSLQLHKMYQSRCTAKNSWWWAERLPETCRVVIPIKLEISASVCFIHKESVTMHGHTIVKFAQTILHYHTQNCQKKCFILSDINTFTP